MARIKYSPSEFVLRETQVRVLVGKHTFVGRICRPDGHSLKCWLGDDLAYEFGDDREMIDALAEAANAGALGKSGLIEV